MTEPSRVLGGRYVLRAQIGRGAMGVIWLASDQLLHRDVAVKQVLLPTGLSDTEVDEARTRAMREARIAARLHHPHAVSVFDVVTEDGRPWLVLEYVRSRSLAQVLDDGGPLPPVEAARIGARVAAALAAAHELGIVHRDVKPGNVLLGDRGTVKITDFGIARALGDVTVTRTGMLAGTPAYLAPEVARGAVPDASSDVFSLGATLYAATEGRPPFGLDENSLAMLHRVASGQYDPPRRAGPLTGVLTHLLDPDPTARPTAAKVVELLGAVERGQPPAEPPTRLILGAPPSSGGTRLDDGAWDPERRRRWPLPVAMASALLAVIAAIVVVALPTRNPQPPGNAAPPTSTTGPSASSTTSAPNTLGGQVPATASSAPAPTTTPPPTTSDAGVTEVAEFVAGHYAALPEDTRTAWHNLTPRRRPDYADYTRFWGQFAEVSQQGRPKVAVAGPARFTVEVTIRFQPRSGGKASVEAYRLLVVTVDGRLMIDDSARMNG